MHPVPDPSARRAPTRTQAAQSTAFDGGEGIWLHEGVLFFSTKGDNRIWAYDVGSSMLTVLYDAASSPTPILSGVDSLTVTTGGEVLVAEDGGHMQIVAIAPDRSVYQLLQVLGQPGSEITGPAFDPSGQRLYFSSQRGSSRNPFAQAGITYEVSGPFQT